MTIFASGSSESGSKTVELEMLLSDDTLEGGAMADAVARFNAEYADKGIQVKINEIAYADIKTQILNRASVNELPDLVKTTEFAQFADFMQPLSTLKQEDFVLTGSDEEGFKAPAVNATAVGLFINKTAFDQAGVSYPTTEEERWTWDEFVEALKTVVANSDVDYGLVIDHSQQRINTVLYQFGYKEYSEDGTTILYDSQETRDGLNFLLSLYRDGISPVSVGLGTENAQNSFKTGRVAAHLAGNWVITDYTNNIKDFEWIPVLMPYEKAKATCLDGNFLYAFKGTGHEAEAEEFINWFYKPENYAIYCQKGNYIPGMRGVEVTYNVPGLEIFNMELNASISQPTLDNDVRSAHAGSSWGNATRDTFDKVIAGEMTVEEMIPSVVAQIRAAYPEMK